MGDILVDDLEQCCLCGESEDLWECDTCGESYCQTHWHQTELGKNIECSGCERKRLEESET